MTNNAANVSTGKPKAAGAIFTAPYETETPTDATTALVAAFLGLGYVSEDGLVNAIETDTESIPAWGGDTVLMVNTSREETFTFTFIETNENVLSEVYGEDNVTVGLDDEITVVHSNIDRVPRRYVFEIALTNKRVKRIVVPRAQITEVGEVTYADGEAIGYEVTIAALPDGPQGITATEYIASVA